MDRSRLSAELMRDEGEVLHAYEDSAGWLTIAVGRMIDARRGGGISHAESMVLLGNDIQRIELALQDRIRCWHRLCDARQRALMNMAFQLGVRGLMNFQHMLAAIDLSNWQAAHDQCLESAYARQTPARANRIAAMLLRGRA